METTTAPQAPGAGEAAPSAGGASNGTTSASPSFADLVAKGRDLRYTVSYRMTTSGAGALNGTMTQYYGGPDEYRIDSTVGPTTTRTYVVNGTVTTCFSTSGSWYCTQQQAQSANGTAQSAPSASASAYSSSAYAKTSTGTETIAGTSAHCFRVVSNGTSADYCLSPEGIPLKTDITAGSVRTTMIATSYSKSLPAGVWTMPTSAGSTPGMPPMPPGYGS